MNSVGSFDIENNIHTFRRSNQEEKLHFHVLSNASEAQLLFDTTTVMDIARPQLCILLEQISLAKD